MNAVRFLTFVILSCGLHFLVLQYDFVRHAIPQPVQQYGVSYVAKSVEQFVATASKAAETNIQDKKSTLSDTIPKPLGVVEQQVQVQVKVHSADIEEAVPLQKPEQHEGFVGLTLAEPADSVPPNVPAFISQQNVSTRLESLEEIAPVSAASVKQPVKSPAFLPSVSEGVEGENYQIADTGKSVPLKKVIQYEDFAELTLAESVNPAPQIVPAFRFQQEKSTRLESLGEMTPLASAKQSVESPALLATGIESVEGESLEGFARAMPRYEINPLPVYPEIARRRGQQGTVQLEVLVLENGRVGTTRLTRSTGFKNLDRAAQKAVKRWKFEPATSFGHSVKSKVVIPIDFVLEDN